MGNLKSANFIENIIQNDIAQGKNNSEICTRFPPEPNGFLHIGHAKSICLNFGVAKKYNAPCHLRFDDTNPLKESTEYIDAIIADVKWLGFEWDKLCYASDYFEHLYEYAIDLIKLDKAYVCSLSSEEIRENRGTLTEPGINSPYRKRSIEGNIDLFTRMRAGEFKEGTHVLRAKIDMASPNINMRDPVIYRILHTTHHRTGTAWCIYPTYDFTQCLSDAIEKVTHSLCTLEFADHRPLYDWFLDQLKTHHPQQIEFARLQLEYSLTSKRKLKNLIDRNIVTGWDDPRLLTLSGMRKRGIPATTIRNFSECIGLTKKDSWIEMGVLETCIRDYLNETAPRTMAVIHPLKLVIENYPEDKFETIPIPNHPQQTELGTRNIIFSKVIYIEQDDFMETPTKKFFRLSLGEKVKLRYSYCIQCEEVIRDQHGNIQELRCTYDPESNNKERVKELKVKGIVHWVSEREVTPAQVNLYEQLFTVTNPALYDNPDEVINPNSLTVIQNCLIPTYLLNAELHKAYQCERLGYFCRAEASLNPAIFNRIITLRDSPTMKNFPTSKKSASQ